jgi:hypothetical protein
MDDLKSCDVGILTQKQGPYGGWSMRTLGGPVIHWHVNLHKLPLDRQIQSSKTIFAMGINNETQLYKNQHLRLSKD